MKTRKPSHNSVELKRTSNWVAIATACRDASENEKTGDMIQIYFLSRNSNPVDAVANGQARHICFDCPLLNNGCYVNRGQGAYGLYGSWVNGNVPQAALDYLPAKPVRFGALGEPVLLGRDTVDAIAKRSGKWTGYTHQWRRPEYQWAREYFMASCETEADVQLAWSMGWRTFRASSGPMLKGEIECLNDKRGTKCADCGICNGANGNARRASVKIDPHGFQANRFAKFQPTA